MRACVQTYLGLFQRLDYGCRALSLVCRTGSLELAQLELQSLCHCLNGFQLLRGCVRLVSDLHERQQGRVGLLGDNLELGFQLPSGSVRLLDDVGELCPRRLCGSIGTLELPPQHRNVGFGVS